MRKPKLSPGHRRALELLAGCSAGMTDSLMLTHRITRTVLAELVVDRLASTDAVRMTRGGKFVEVRRFKITDAGRRAMENVMPAFGLSPPPASSELRAPRG